MLTRLLTVWHAIRASLWPMPVFAVLLAVALAIAASKIQIKSEGHSVWYLYSGDAADASEFLANLTSAVVTLATLVVSITMVVLTLAAQQLGPRLITSFISDLKTQVALALFVGTAAYLLILLRMTSGADGVANLALTFASVLVGLSIFTLPVFVHHLARSIVADNVIKRVGAALDDAISDEPAAEQGETDGEDLFAVRDTDKAIRIETGGYVQAVDVSRLIGVAAAHDALVVLKYRAGQHALPGSIGAWVRSPDPPSDDFRAAVNGAVIFGAERTPVQDVEFWLRQLVEVGVRALSPGQNDPYTVIAVIDRLALSFKRVIDRPPVRAIWRDEDGAVRLLMPVSTFEGLADAAFDQVRQYGASHPAVVIRLAEKLAQLWQFANALQRAALEKHLMLVLSTGRRNIEDENDRADLERHVAAALDEHTAASSATPDAEPPPALAHRLRLQSNRD